MNITDKNGRQQAPQLRETFWAPVRNTLWEQVRKQTE